MCAQLVESCKSSQAHCRLYALQKKKTLIKFYAFPLEKNVAYCVGSASIPLKWQMKAVTRTGTTVKRFHTDAISVTLGRNLGMAILPLKSLTTVIPAVMTRKTSASATAKADVYLNESASIKKH